MPVGLGLLSNQMSSTGTSSSWTKGRANAHRIFTLFACTIYAKILKDLPEEVRQGEVSDLPELILRSPELWEQFAGYLFDGYVIEKGKSMGRHLAPGSVEDVLNAVIGLAGHKYKRVG